MKNDAIFPVTRGVAAIVVLALVTAIWVVYFLPDRTGELFAWAITPRLSSMFLGAVYMGGAWPLFQTAIGKYWHRVHAMFPAVTAFTIVMLASTILHWDRFAHENLAFKLWVFLYAVSPFLISALWIYNRRTDTNEPEASDAVVPATMLLGARIIGIGVLLFITAGFLYPALLTSFWPWTLTPLTARVICGWLSVIGVGAWVLSSEPRWTAWRSSFEAIFLVDLLLLVACILNPGELTPGILNWFTGLSLIALIGLSLFYLKMEGERKKGPLKT